MANLFIDFETRSALDLKKVGADVYAKHPSTQVMAFGYAFDDHPVKINKLNEQPATEVVSAVKASTKTIAHNATFEWLIWNYTFKRQFPNLPKLNIEQLHCTMVMCYAMGLPGSLEKASAALGIDQQKDMKGNRVMLQLSQPREVENEQITWWDPTEHKDKYDRMYAYCAQDIEVEREIFKRVLPLSNDERDMWLLDHRINQRGIRVDVPAAVEAVNIVDFESTRLDQEMRNVTNNEVATCTAHKQLTSWIKSKGVQTDGVSKSDVTDLLAEKSLPDSVRRALQARKEAAKSSTAKFQSIIDRSGKDERIRSTLQYYGAQATGRWAGRGLQIHNLPRPKLNKNEIEGVFKILHA